MDQAYYNEAFRLSAKAAVTGGLIFIACLFLGCPAWKAVVAAAVIFVAHRAGIGRRYSEILAFVAVAIALIWWTEVLPSRAAIDATISSFR